jgi:RNA polymerase sigma factor (TIGR02999 family)
MNGDSADTISALLERAENGDNSAFEALFAELYSELRRLAPREIARRAGSLTLTPTTLLHEAYLEIAGRSGTFFPDRARFMAYAARVMRGLIIDYARNRQALKRGGQFEITQLATEPGAVLADERELTFISDALNELATLEPELAEIVDLKFFCGFSFSEIAALRGVSERTVQRKWEKARIYLHRGIRGPVSL